MAEMKPDLPWVRRELGSISRDLTKTIDQWEPPTVRELARELARVVTVLEVLYPELEWDGEPPHVD